MRTGAKELVPKAGHGAEYVNKRLGFQELILVTRDNGFTTEELMGVAFVPLVGKHGFKE